MNGCIGELIRLLIISRHNIACAYTLPDFSMNTNGSDQLRGLKMSSGTGFSFTRPINEAFPEIFDEKLRFKLGFGQVTV